MKLQMELGIMEREELEESLQTQAAVAGLSVVRFHEQDQIMCIRSELPHS